MKLYKLLQLNGGTFPTGGFSQSWGLETYVAEGKINSAETFKAFLDTYLVACIGKCEGPIICSAYKAAQKNDYEELREIEVFSKAAKVTKESREGALRMGKAFIRIMEATLPDERTTQLLQAMGTKEITYPVAYGFFCQLMDIPMEEALEAYVYSTANTLVQSAIKLIPLGNTEAQRILFVSDAVMEKTVKLALATEPKDITNFCPGIDIASIRHETLPVRLYMS